jgi:enoyl-CoA hydratase/carnithine racemase
MGKRHDAAEAYRIGLVDELLPDAHVIERAEAVSKKIIANAHRAWRCKSPARRAS